MSTDNQLTKIIQKPATTASHSVIWLHGLGADGNDFADIASQLNLPADHAIRFIFPHAPMRPVTINGGRSMRAWYDIYSLERAEREDDEGLADTQLSVNTLIEQEEESGIPSKNIILAGFSQGGAIALYVGLRYPRQLGGLLALSCYLPKLAHTREERADANKNTTIFMAHGSNDPVVSLAAGAKTYDQLQALDYPVTFKKYPMEHSLCLDEISDIGTWLSERFSK